MYFEEKTVEIHYPARYLKQEMESHDQPAHDTLEVLQASFPTSSRWRANWPCHWRYGGFSLHHGSLRPSAERDGDQYRLGDTASGKDLRRIVSRGLTVTNAVKENAVQRMLLAMDFLAVEQAVIMPDRSNLARRVLQEVEGDLRQMQVSQLALPYVLGTEDDSIRATALMVEQGVDVLIVLGGDGTSRVVSKRCGDVPILPVSTGTNNVFPEMIEGTVVGMAAAALVDSIGMSAIGAQVQPLAPFSGKACCLLLGEGERRITAPIAPGLMAELQVRDYLKKPDSFTIPE